MRHFKWVLHSLINLLYVMTAKGSVFMELWFLHQGALVLVRIAKK